MKSEYQQRVSIAIKAALKRRNVSYAELSHRLKQIPDAEVRSPEAIKQAIYRGSFSKAFDEKCRDVIGENLSTLSSKLREKLLKNGLTYKKLSLKLKENGVIISEPAIAKAISRNQIRQDVLDGCKKILQ